MSGTCSCGSSWTAPLAAHCARCHATYPTVREFDGHRRGGDSRAPSATESDEPARRRTRTRAGRE